MGWNLPPGCTDKDIDDAINGDEPPLTPEEQEDEAKRMREEDREAFAHPKQYIEEHRASGVWGLDLANFIAQLRGYDE